MRHFLFAQIRYELTCTEAPDMEEAKQSPKTAAIHVLSLNAVRFGFPTPEAPLRKHGNYSQQPKQLRRRANKSQLEF